MTTQEIEKLHDALDAFIDEMDRRSNEQGAQGHFREASFIANETVKLMDARAVIKKVLEDNIPF